MTPEYHTRLETLRLSIETIKTALETAEVQETETNHITFMNIVREELRSLSQTIERIEAIEHIEAKEHIKVTINVPTTEKTSIVEPRREAAPPSSFWSVIFMGHFWSTL